MPSLRHIFTGFLVALAAGAAALQVSAQNEFEKRRISSVTVVVPGMDPQARQVRDFTEVASDAVGALYSTPRIRDAIQELYTYGRTIHTITVSAERDPAGDVRLTFHVRMKTQASRVTIGVAESVGDNVTEQELLLKLNLLTAGAVVTEQILRDNADEILAYLRERGFYRSTVTFEQRPATAANQTAVVFKVTPGEQARVERFDINIAGLPEPIDVRDLKLEPARAYSRERLTTDVATIKKKLRENDFLAPELEEPRVVYDDEANTVAISLTGKVGPKVEIAVEAERDEVGRGTQNRLLPVRSEGTLDYSAIVEGARRLENYYQEQGYFFADVVPICSAAPPLLDNEDNPIGNETQFLCQFLGGEDLMGRNVTLKYFVDLNRRLSLNELRIRGTDKITIEDVRTVLGSQEASALGIIPFLGYGRGYTSEAILEDDANTIRSIMAELGYRDARVRATQGVSPEGEELIITFVVEEGLSSVVTEVKITGNTAVPTDELNAVLPQMVGANYSRAKIRNAVRKLSQLYSERGYFDARVTSTITDLPVDPAADRRPVRVEFKIEGEGQKVVIGRILVEGNEDTRLGAVRKALALREGELLTAPDIYASEQNLYSSDAFSRVTIKPQPAGEDASGNRVSDVLVSLEEQPPRLMTYGGGYSTDVGLSGFFDIRHVNLLGRLWQGGARIKLSQRQQLIQFDLVQPRFLRDGKKRFSPLTLTAQYQRDTTVTRFFRSAFDRGTFGIVQRVDEDGNPIDEFGRNVGSPTINRAALFAETSRTISRKDRSILFFRYRFEDVRLYNIESLLIKDLLQPDARNRISGFGATFVRDTRKNCSTKYSLLDLIDKGEQTDPCRYNASDPTGGHFLTADYNVSIPAMGANVGFQKFQVSYNYYYTFKRATIATRAILGAGRVFKGGDRYAGSQFPFLKGLLPISERFFGGGPNTLRGFDFEEAGPRVVIVPTGKFRNSNGEEVFLDPFTIPFGGNAIAVVNVEGRIPLSRSIRAVPFYDGGNVFRKASDIFKKPEVAAGDIAGFNQRAAWTHSVGLGLRLKTPVGGEFGVDFGYLLNPPSFLIPQTAGPPATYRLKREQIHFRFSQAF
jgi:outer membrane protein insertion porin family